MTIILVLLTFIIALIINSIISFIKNYKKRKVALITESKFLFNKKVGITMVDGGESFNKNNITKY